MAANETWAMDVVPDQLATGHKRRVLSVVDTFSRFSPVPDARFSRRGEDVVATLDPVCIEAGVPRTSQVNQGSEFVPAISNSGPTTGRTDPTARSDKSPRAP